MNGFILHLLNSIQAQGWLGCIAFVLLYSLACVTLLPGSLLTLGAGVIYGFFLGTALISAGSLLGATLSFLLSRYFLRGWLEKRLAANKKFQLLDAAVAREGWKIILLSRLTPIFPFSLLNYGLGLTGIPLSQFMLASWLGTLPLNAAYVYAGMVAGSLTQLNGETAATPLSVKILQVVGLVATIILSVYVTRLASRTLQGKLD